MTASKKVQKDLNHIYLDCLEPGGVIVCKLLEDVSRSEAKRAQAMQDGSLEA